MGFYARHCARASQLCSPLPRSQLQPPLMPLMPLHKLLPLTLEMERTEIEAGDQQLSLLRGRRTELRHSKSGLPMIIMLLFVSRDPRDHSQVMVCLKPLHKRLMVLLYLLHKLDQVIKHLQNK